ANVLALRAVVDGPSEQFAAYNVCSGQPVGIADVARQVAGGTGSREITPQITGGYRLGDGRHIVASPARATSALGFTAQVSPEQGLAEFATAPLRA
ncbi:MAG: NAD-dependent dehydratase, partial [Ornithinimicrobium sp.]